MPASSVFAGGGNRVINGEPASSAITYQVALQTTNGNLQTLCGGSILTPTMVLTAGHCVRDLTMGTQSNPQQMTLTPGRTRTPSSATRNVIRYWVEPSYTASTAQSRRVDLAIVETVAAFTLNAQVQPIRMCTGTSCFTPFGTAVTVSGYGETVSDTSSSTSTTLLSASLFTVSDTQCQSKFEANFRCVNCLPLTNVCAGSNGGQDSCFGDSGGPLVRDFGGSQGVQLLGVVSSGTVPASQSPSCGQPGEYGLYVSVPANQAWIQRVLSGLENGTAVTSACVQTGTCTSTPGTPGGGGGASTLTFASWYYIAAAVIGGLVLLLMLAMCLIRYCRRRHPPRAHVRNSPMRVHSVHHVAASAPPVQPQYPVYAPPPSAPPPPYGAPVYQTSPPTYVAGPQQPPMYNPQPQMYGAPQPQMYPPPAPVAYNAPPPSSPPPQYGRM